VGKDNLVIMAEIPSLEEQINSKNISIASMREQLAERAKLREQSSKLFFDLEEKVSAQMLPSITQLGQGE
jgi:TolA-binding protein